MFAFAYFHFTIAFVAQPMQVLTPGRINSGVQPPSVFNRTFCLVLNSSTKQQQCMPSNLMATHTELQLRFDHILAPNAKAMVPIQTPACHTIVARYSFLLHAIGTQMKYSLTTGRIFERVTHVRRFFVDVHEVCAHCTIDSFKQMWNFYISPVNFSNLIRVDRMPNLLR